MATTLTNNLTYDGTDKGYIFQPIINPNSTLSEFAFYPEVTGKMKIPKVGSITKTAQDGGDCGFEATGSMTISDQAFALNAVKHNIEICKNDIKNTYAAKTFSMNDPEQDLTGDDVYDAILEQVFLGVNRDMMDIVWFGDTGTATLEDYLEQADGFFKAIDAAITMNVPADVTGASATTGALATDEALTILDYLYTNAPSQLKQLPKNQRRFYISGSLYDNLESSLSGTDTSVTNLNIFPQDILGGVDVLSFKGVIDQVSKALLDALIALATSSLVEAYEFAITLPLSGEKTSNCAPLAFIHLPSE